MQEQITFFTLPISELKSLISQTLQEVLASNQTTKKEEQELPQYLTRKETAKILGVTLVTLHSYTNKGKIKAYKIGGRIRYKKLDIEKSVKLIPNFLTD